MESDNERIKRLLTETVTLLCKNSITYQDELRVEGLVGVSVDKKEVFFVHICKEFSKRCVSTTSTDDVPCCSSTQQQPPPPRDEMPLEVQTAAEDLSSKSCYEDIDDDNTDIAAAANHHHQFTPTVTSYSRPYTSTIEPKHSMPSSSSSTTTLDMQPHSVLGSHGITLVTSGSQHQHLHEPIKVEPIPDDDEEECLIIEDYPADRPPNNNNSKVVATAVATTTTTTTGSHSFTTSTLAQTPYAHKFDNLQRSDSSRSLPLPGHFPPLKRKSSYTDLQGRHPPPKKRALQEYEEMFNVETVADEPCWPPVTDSNPIAIYPTTVYDPDSDASLVSTEDGTRSESASWSDLSQIPETSSLSASRETSSPVKLLRCRLLQRQASQPELSSITKPSPPPRPLDLSTMDRKEIRRYQNRVAAQKSRAKKRAEAARVYNEYQKVLKTNGEIQEKLMELLKEREQYAGLKDGAPPAPPSVRVTKLEPMRETSKKSS